MVKNLKKIKSYFCCFSDNLFSQKSPAHSKMFIMGLCATGILWLKYFIGQVDLFSEKSLSAAWSFLWGYFLQFLCLQVSRQIKAKLRECINIVKYLLSSVVPKLSVKSTTMTNTNIIHWAWWYCSAIEVPLKCGWDVVEPCYPWGTLEFSSEMKLN